MELFRKLLHWITSPFASVERAGVPVELLLALVVVVILVHLATRMGRHAAASATDARSMPTAGTRGEAWYWSRAEGFASAGEFGAAMLAAFHAAMLGVVRRRGLPLRAGVTPREWLGRADLPTDCEARLRPVVATLYRTAFAAEATTAPAYRDWVQALREATDAAQA